jgi:undecaprenyl diphosphate synthase
MQSTPTGHDPLHVAIILDGNGRWARRRGLPRAAGHRAGADAVRRVVEAAPGLGVTALTLYAFSSDNWRRPAAEVTALMALLRHYLRTELRRLAEAGARLKVIGRRDRLPDGLADEIADAERATADGTGLSLQIAIDYSGRDAIARAAAAWPGPGAPTHATFTELLADLNGGPGSAVDLLIRSGGETRLSDFLLWEAAYAELYFLDTLWPDFTPEDLRIAIADLRRRDRRFGGLPASERLVAAE